jgi:hypothetical protein
MTWPSEELTELVYSMFPQGREDPITRIPLGVLKICLRETPPFQTATDDTIHDVRYEDRLLSCPHRSLLIDTLAAALWQYEADGQKSEKESEDPKDTRQYALRVLSEAVEDFQGLRAKKALLPAGKHLPRNRTLVKSLQDLTEMVNALSDPRQNLNTAKDTTLLRLCLVMQDAFVRYVPRVKDTEIRHAIAAILSALGVEQGTLPAIAGRMKKRLQRASHPQD